MSSDWKSPHKTSEPRAAAMVADLQADSHQLPSPEVEQALLRGDPWTFLSHLPSSVELLGLQRIERYLDAIGNPQGQVQTLHVAGTNGKGSVCAMVASVLQAAGYRVGLTVSPHLLDVRERIQLNGQWISRPALGALLSKMQERYQTWNWPRNQWLTYFETFVALAFEWFVQEGVEVAVIETGLGGRLDGTNVLKKPLATVITSIGYDHMELLGTTLGAIAREKAGILKPGSLAVVGPRFAPEAKEVIESTAHSLGVTLQSADPNRYVLDSMSYETGLQSVRDVQARQVYDVNLLGTHQVDNVATALEVVTHLARGTFSIPESAIVEGLKNVLWPARMQVFPSLRLMVDGSHNEAGFTALRASLKLLFGPRPPQLGWVVSMRNNRPLGLLGQLIQAFPETRAIFCTTYPGRSHLFHSPDALARYCGTFWTAPGVSGSQVEVRVCPTPEEAIKALEAWSQELCPGHEPRYGIVTGSLYTAGSVLGYLSGENLDACNC